MTADKITVSRTKFREIIDEIKEIKADLEEFITNE